MAKHCVLIVDNDAQTVERFKTAFQDLECELLTAENGQEALHLIVQSQPSVIISEWQLPVFDGLGLFLQVKNSPHTNHIPFIFLTEVNDIDVRLALLESGAEDYWGKPYDLREAKLRVRRLLERLGSPNVTRRHGGRFKTSAGEFAEPLDIVNGRYELIEKIGRGGMGEVYRAFDIGRDREVALKVLRQEYVADQVAVRRFAREAEAAMRIRHPNVVETYEYGLISTGQAYIAMELLEGRSLEEELFAQGRLPQDRVLEVMRPVCLAVAEAHLQGVVHRDLKPSNVFLIRSTDLKDPVKVMDFGIALLQNPPNASMRITAADMTVGTPLYLSPEQAAGDIPDKRSDIYSLGVVFYELLAGSPPFNGNNYKEVMLSHLRERPAPIKNMAQVCEWLSELVMRMLSKAPARRPQSVGEILNVIDQRIGERQTANGEQE